MTVERGSDGRGRRRHGGIPATPLSPSIFSMIFKRANTLYVYVRTFLRARIHVNGPDHPLRLGRRWLALLRRGCHRRKSGNDGRGGERERGRAVVVGGRKALGCPWVERGGLVQRCRWLHEPADR